MGAKKEANVIRMRIQGRVPERNQRGGQSHPLAGHSRERQADLPQGSGVA